MNSIILDLDYYFKGSSNINVTLVQDGSGEIKAISSFGEVMKTFPSGTYTGRLVRELLRDLEDGKYS